MKTIAITGSSSGIGKATAKYFAEHSTKWAVEGFSESLAYELPDAQQVYGMREQVGDDAFVAGIKQRMLA